MSGVRDARSGNSMLYPKAFYLLYYAASASLLPFLILFYRELGLSGRQIGILAGMLPLTTLLAAPFWGELADATGRSRRLLLFAMAATFVPVALIAQSSSFLAVAVAVFLFALLFSPVMPIVDNAVLDALADRQHDYGRQRLWGAVGWGLAAPLVGVVTERAGISWAFYFYLALMAFAFLVAFRLPVPETGPRRGLGNGLGQILTDWAWLAFLASAFLGGAALSVTHSFLLLHMSDLGSTRTLIGLALTVATLSELPVFLWAGALLRRFGPSLLLALALLVFIVRMLALSLVTVPELVLPLQLLHGPSYAVLWISGIALAKQMAPAGSGNAAQGLFAATVMGMGAAMGGFVGGALYDAVGAAGMFQWVAVGLITGLLLARLSGRLGARGSIGHRPRERR